MAAADASYPAARNPMAFPWLARGGLAAHRVRRLYLFWSNHADAWVDVTGTLDRKLAALRAHASQIDDLPALEDRVRARAAEAGETIGVEAADAFRVIVIDDDEDEGPGGEASPPDESGSGEPG
jgi:LmbE family N-acetylglucosaminyl deacetylase